MGLWLSIGAGLTNMALDYVFYRLFRWGVAGRPGYGERLYGGGFIPLSILLPNKSPLRLVKTRLYPGCCWKSATNGSSELMTNVSASW